MKTATTTLILCVGSLLALGMVTLYSSSVNLGSHYLTMQSAWSACGIFICMVAALCDYRWLKKVSWPLFIVSVGALAAVLVFGHKVNGSRRWFPLGFANFQPSELAKFALIVMLAYYGEKFQ